MKMKDIKNLSETELVKELGSLREQVRDLSFKIHSKEVKNSHKLKNVRRDISRILTLINDKK